MKKDLLMTDGDKIIRLARQHVGESYENVVVPKNNQAWNGPWDCAEFASWCVFQVSEVLYGCANDRADPGMADAYTGCWKRDAQRLGVTISVDEAAATVGAAVLRFPPGLGKMGHIALSNGEGGTVEAHSHARGVTSDVIAGRRWDIGVLVPGLTYSVYEPSPIDEPRKVIYRLRRPRMRGTVVKEIQRALKRNGFNPGPVDSEYGPLTAAAVVAFQVFNGLVGDGEVGPMTARKLTVVLPDV